MSKYRRVNNPGGQLFDVGILDDGTLWNPRRYPEDVVRAAVLAADARRRERRSNAAKKAGETRRRRLALHMDKIVKRMLAGDQIQPAKNCRLCGRGLTDQESITRGIGSECWGGVQNAIERQLANRAA
jgi:Family of unknown function (DUF6011)